MADFRKRRATCRGSLTKIITQVDTQDVIHPSRRDPAAVKRLCDALNRTEESYTTNYSSVLDGTLHLESDQLDEVESAHSEFIKTVDITRSRLNAMLEQREAYRLHETLVHEVDDWEDADLEDIKVTFLDEYPRLRDSLGAFRSSTCATGVTDLLELKSHVRDLRRRLSNLKRQASSMTKDEEEDSYRQDRKARTVPLPTFSGELADWRSFWRRFTDYIGKLKRITDDERLSYLQDCLEDPKAQSLVADAIRNGDSFEQVEKRLHRQYDQPREVYSGALKALMQLPLASYTRAGVTQLSQELNKYRNILLRYGDGTLDQAITAIAESCMHQKFREEWKLHTEDRETIPPASKLIEFCDNRGRVLSDKDDKKDKLPFKPSPHTPSKGQGKSAQMSLHVCSLLSCRLCQNGSHRLSACPELRNMDGASRQQTVQTLQACYNCLGTDHAVKNCPSKRSCRECGRRHHSLLHRTEVSRPPPQQSKHATPQSQEVSSLTAAVPGKTVIVRSCQVLVEVEGRTQVVRAMIDPGAAISFITGRVVSSLKAKRIPSITCVSGLEETPTSTSYFKVDVTVRDLNNPDHRPVQFTPAVVSTITGNTPANDLTQSEDLDFAQNLRLADPNFGSSGRIDLLLGLDVIPRITRQGVIVSPSESLTANETMFGWVISGYCVSPQQAVTTHICCKTDVIKPMNDLLKAFWEAEELPSDFNHVSAEDQSALEQFKDTVSRDGQGRYVVSLPVKESALPLGHSRPQAFRRLEQNEKSLSRKGKWQEFCDAVEEYAQLDHSEPVPAADLQASPSESFYMPMHGVIKEASTSTNLEKEETQFIVAPRSCHKALGIHWDTVSDTFHVATPHLDSTAPSSKRQVLSDVARTFDALGWFSPVTVTLKILLQKIWQLDLDWDEDIPKELAEIWITWRKELPLVTSHPVIRWYYQPYKERLDVQLHGYCDASQAAFAGVVYVRATYVDTAISTSLVLAKSKVAPIKTVTIPKLELCSAVLLCKLLSSVREELKIDSHKVFAWSDSTIALGWIGTSPHRLKTYVANRVVAINELVPASHWRRVSSADNPADIGSRGTTAKELIQSSFWWSGPPWLSLPPAQWPALRQREQSTLPELKTTILTIQEPIPALDLVTRYSVYSMLINVLSWICSFASNCRKEVLARNLNPSLTAEEIWEVEALFIRHQQKQYLSKEYIALQSGSPVAIFSPIYSLCPVLDSEGALRVGGRLSNADVTYSQRYPVILHKRGEG